MLLAGQIWFIVQGGYTRADGSGRSGVGLAKEVVRQAISQVAFYDSSDDRQRSH